MKKISVLVLSKESEPGLLAIIDKRVKSLIPVLGGKRIIDFYIGPALLLDFKQVIIFADREMVKIKDYLVYTYNTNKVKVVGLSSTSGSLFDTSTFQEGENLFVLRADNLILPEWNRFFEFLNGLPDGDYEVLSSDKDTLGFLLKDIKPIEELKLKEEEIPSEVPRIDRKWEILKVALQQRVERVQYEMPFFRVKTVSDYYSLHLLMLKNMEDILRLYSKIPVKSGNDENLSQIGSSGFVKNSHVSSSCAIDGYVESSIIFSNVKIGRYARVIKSIVMDNNFIGDGAVVQNAILCDNNELFSKVLPNIGEDSRIGEDDDTGANNQFPLFINSGITLIGQNVEIPKGFRVSRNCYIASDVNKATLRAIERVKAGDSILF